MSTKRTKSSSKRGPSNREMARSPLFATKKDDSPKFSYKEHVLGAQDADFVAYNTSSKYERGALISHAKFGRGVVTNAEESRIEVLFEDGSKKLGHALTA